MSAQFYPNLLFWSLTLDPKDEIHPELLHDQIDTITSSSVITGRCRSPCFEERPANAIVSADVESRQARVDFADAIPWSQNHDDFAADLQRLSLAFCQENLPKQSRAEKGQMSWILHLCTDCSLGAQSPQPPDWEQPQFGGPVPPKWRPFLIRKLKPMLHSLRVLSHHMYSIKFCSHFRSKMVFFPQIEVVAKKRKTSINLPMQNPSPIFAIFSQDTDDVPASGRGPS